MTEHLYELSIKHLSSYCIVLEFTVSQLFAGLVRVSAFIFNPYTETQTLLMVLTPAAAICLVLLLLVVFFCCCCRKRAKKYVTKLPFF